MQGVETLCSKYDEVHMIVSRSGDLVDRAYPNSSTSTSGGAANTFVATPPQPPEQFKVPIRDSAADDI